MKSLYRQFIKKLFHKSYIKNTSILISGTVGGQIINLIFSPVLTRLFSPTEFGLLGIFTAIGSILSVIASGKYEMSIMLPKNNVRASSLCISALLISFTFCIVLLMCIFFLLEKNVMYLTDLGGYSYLLPVYIFFSSAFQSLNYWHNRLKRFSLMSQRKIYQSISTSLSSVFLGLINVSGGLILGQTIGFFVSFFHLLIDSIKKDISYFKEYSLKKSLKYLAIYNGFPLKIAPSTLLNLFAYQIPILLISSLFNSAILGLYLLVVKVLSAPMTIIGSSVSQVFYQNTNETFLQKNLFPKIRKTSLVLLVVISLPMIFIIFWGPEIFSYVFGKDWKEAGTIARTFAPFFIIRFIVSSQSTILITLSKYNMQLYLNLLLFITQVGSLYLGYLKNDISDGFFYMSMSGTIVYLFWLIYIFYIGKVNDNR